MATSGNGTGNLVDEFEESFMVIVLFELHSIFTSISKTVESSLMYFSN